MRFADIIGQEDLKRHLAQSVDAGRVSHAQLFTGLSGSGALALAVAYVQYLCCRHRRDGDSCGECPDCKQIASLAHPDLHLVFPVNKQGKKSGEVMRSDEFLPLFRTLFDERGGYVSPQDWYDRLDLGKTLKGMIAAREADEIIRKLSFKSFEADYKTMLIWLPEAMNEEAANKILKILEEPWERTLFILVSEQPDRLLPTIISRTQEVCVPRIAPDVLARVAAERGVSDPLQARNMARLAGGDLNALLGLLGFALGILAGVFFLKRGYSLKRTYTQTRLDGFLFPAIQVIVFILLVAAPAFIFFTEAGGGPGAKHAPILISLAAGLIVGALAQRTRLCMVGGIRDVVLFREPKLIMGFGAILISALVCNLILNGATDAAFFHLGFADQPVAHTDGACGAAAHRHGLRRGQLSDHCGQPRLPREHHPLRPAHGL